MMSLHSKWHPTMTPQPATAHDAYIILSMDPDGPPPAPKETPFAAEVLLKDDPKFLMYRRMLKVGLLKETAAFMMANKNAVISYGNSVHASRWHFPQSAA